MASSVLRSIFRQAASCNWAGRSVNRVYRICDRKYSEAAAPWLMLPPSIEDGGKVFHKFYSPADNKVTSVRKRSSIGEAEINLELERETVLVGSSHGWLALYNARWDLFLYNPISHHQIKLPSVQTIPLAEKRLRYCWGQPIKVILSCPPLEQGDDVVDSNSCRVIMCFGPRSNMALCCPTRSSKWTPFGAQFHENEEINEFYKEDRVVRGYEDYVYSTTQKQLFCVTRLINDFECWDLEDPTSPKLNWKKAEDDFDYDEENYPWAARSDKEYELKDDLSNQFKYLVFAEHSNQLFLIHRHVIAHMGPDGSRVKPVFTGLGLLTRGGLDDTTPHKTVGFDVHEIDREKGEMRYMDGTLNGMAFFIGSTGHGFVVESPDTMNLKPNSIYFTDPKERTPQYWDKHKTYGGHDLGIYDYGKGTFSPCYYPFDIQKFRRIQPAPMWFTPSPSPSPSPSPV